MSMHLAEVALAVAPRAHALVLMDQAGWQMTGKLEIPANISIALTGQMLQEQPRRNIWLFMRDN